MANEFSFAELSRIVQKRFKFILAIAVAAGVLATIFSGKHFIKPRFKSTTVVYPSNISAYSEESRTEQLQQLFESSDIRDSVINKFGLYTHYDIDSTSESSRFNVINEFNSRVQIKKTKYESVEISAEDESPVMAYNIVKELSRQVDLKARALQRSKSEEIVAMTRRELGEVKQQIDSLEGKLNTLRKEKGLLEYEMQTQEASRGLYRLASSGKTGSADYQEAKRTLDNLKEHGGEFKLLYEQVELANSYYAQRLQAHLMALNDIRKELTYLNTIVYPEVADKKHYPVRWLIVFTAVFSAVLFSIVVFLFAENRIVEGGRG